ncbi:MAG: prolyl aminopeptidase [Methylophilaceae bacterium]|nr:prolyl aminopeptidase [Methylophilaceae bacterium]
MSLAPESLLFPAIEPYVSGHLPTSSRHLVYYEECGNPAGFPVVVLHGGPGSGCTPVQRRFFDPAHYRIILFDQRGCGRSQPVGCIEDNTTRHLLDDIERLRQHLAIERWLVFGGSWGSTLAIAYALEHTEHVCGLILRGVFLATPQELEWFLYRSRTFFPDAWNAFVSPLRDEERSDILASYQRLIFDTAPVTAQAAAKCWNAYESALVSLLPAPATSPSPTGEVLLARARVQLHYLVNGCFLGESPLIAQVDRLRHLPTIIVQGRYDMVCPPCTAYELHQAWPEAELHMVPDAGHAASEPGISKALVQATERFKSVR